MTLYPMAHDHTLPDSPPTSGSVDFQRTAYNYELPSNQIAQNPVVPRDRARLMVVNPGQGCQHHIFRDLPNLLKPGDLLVLNNTRVLPARLYGRKPEGAQVEILLLEEQRSQVWSALVKPGRRLKPGTRIHFGGSAEAPDLIAQVLETDNITNGRILHFEIPSGEPFDQILEQLGTVPLPPYIHQTQAEADQYQTIYATQPGAVAAPTAGLHFTPGLFEQLDAAQINRAFITLHVGVGTFRPVEAQTITEHKMHGEWLVVPQATVDQINQTKAEGGRVIAVGTTVTRALEGAAQSGQLKPMRGKTDLFIYPGYQWQVVDGLITNFHLPESSLLMLVSALIGRQRLMDLYQSAIAADYRFYSFGDAMLIPPEAHLPT
ncbi:MAG: tRNA preQ1(34) S-adenosylmethionine ribosyltransferase-isomerase QueA [Cyanobacteria bacterium J06639_16]